MEKELIESTVASISVGRLCELRADFDRWEETDGGAHFVVSRHVLSTPQALDVVVVAISVSGQPGERARVIGEFSRVYGPPARRTPPGDVDTVDVVAWLEQGAAPGDRRLGFPADQGEQLGL